MISVRKISLYTYLFTKQVAKITKQTSTKLTICRVHKWQQRGTVMDQCDVWYNNPWWVGCGVWYRELGQAGTRTVPYCTVWWVFSYTFATRTFLWPSSRIKPRRRTVRSWEEKKRLDRSCTVLPWVYVLWTAISCFMASGNHGTDRLFTYWTNKCSVRIDGGGRSYTLARRINGYGV